MIKTVFKLSFLMIFSRRLLTGYIDPNTGGMLFQALAIAFGLISALFLFFSGQIKMFFSRFRRSVRERDEDEEMLDEETEEQEQAATDIDSIEPADDQINQQ